MMRDEWTNIENAVNRTEAAVIEEATAIAKIIREKRRHATDIPKFFNN